MYTPYKVYLNEVFAYIITSLKIVTTHKSLQSALAHSHLFETDHYIFVPQCGQWLAQGAVH